MAEDPELGGEGAKAVLLNAGLTGIIIPAAAAGTEV
jgi:hypothetical protein